MGNWIKIKDGDKDGFEIFSRHYTFRKWRQRDGKNGKRFGGPGEQIIMMTENKKALWVWRKEIWRRDGQTGICCAVFRNESELLSSELIREAVIIANERWPQERLFTFVDAKKIKSKHPGACFHKAGWRHCGRTKTKGLYILEFCGEEKKENEKKIISTNVQYELFRSIA